MMATEARPIGATQIVYTRLASLALLLFYIIVTFSLRDHQRFGDEGAALDLGSCVLKGMTLYRDLFHHHLPLPVYIAALVTRFAGVSIPSIRLFMFLLGMVVFASLVWVSRAPFAVAFAAALWALVSPYYLGNMLLYDNLAMLGGMVLGVLTFSALARGMEPSKKMFFMLALAGTVVSLSNPFFVITTFVATGALLFAKQIPRLFVIKLWIAISAALCVFGLQLALSGSLRAFYTDVFIFNTTIYQHYAPLDTVEALRHQLLFLDLFNPEWYRSFHPLQFNPSTIGPVVFDDWFFSGFFYRAVSLGACLMFVLRRDYKTAIFLYAFLMTLPLRKEEGFHAAPFVAFTLFLAGVVVEESLSMPRAAKYKYLILALCGVPALLLGLTGARYLIKHAFESDYFILQAEAKFIREAARGRSDVELAHLPAGNYMYYLTGLRPVSKFVYFYPWVADFGRAQMDRDLEREAAATNVLLVMEIDGGVWNVPNSSTLRSEMVFAKQRLVKENVEWLVAYVSPAISLTPSRPPANVPSHSEPGIYRGGSWLLGPDGGSQRMVSRFGGAPGDVPVTGDWDGSGKTKLGIYRPQTGQWILDMNGNGLIDPGEDVYQFGGMRGDIPVTGDWSGSGKWKMGIYRPSTGEWLLDFDGNGVFEPKRDRRYTFGGNDGDYPVVGDWTGSGRSKIGIFRAEHQWMLDLNGNGIFEPGQDAEFSFGGIAGDIPVTGDWNGNGRSKPGIFRLGFLWILNSNDNYGIAGGSHAADRSFGFGGLPGDKPVSGVW